MKAVSSALRDESGKTQFLSRTGPTANNFLDSGHTLDRPGLHDYKKEEIMIMTWETELFTLTENACKDHERMESTFPPFTC